MTQESYHQPELFNEAVRRTPSDVQRFLAHGAGAPGVVDVVYTRNRVSMISLVFHPPGRVRVRMHEAFLAAPDEVLQALHAYIRTRDRAAWRVVAAFAHGIDGGDGRQVKPRHVRTAGRHFDLAEIAREVNTTFFESKIVYHIGWGRGRQRTRRGRRGRSMRMGSWHAAAREVRIHPLLDDERVPPEFMRYLVFHELLHAVVPSVKRSAGRRDHPAEFRLQERRFPDIRRMRRIASELVEKLLD